MDSFFKQVEQNKTSNNDQPIYQSADLPLYLSTYLCSPSLSSRPYQSQMHCYQFAKYKHNIWSIKSSLTCLLQFILIIALISPSCQPRSSICLISFRDNFSAQWTAKWSRNGMLHLIQMEMNYSCLIMCAMLWCVVRSIWHGGKKMLDIHVGFWRII